MLPVYFNPYPGISDDLESGKQCLLSTAKTYKRLTSKYKLNIHDAEGQDSIRCYILAEESKGVQRTPSSLIREYTGRDRELVRKLFIDLSRGVKLKQTDLEICEDWILTNIDLPAPILEYAARQEGMAITITDDEDWKLNFYEFVDKDDLLPNICGQSDCSPIAEWILNWLHRNVSFKDFLISEYDCNFCKGSLNNCFPSKHEEEGIVRALTRAKSNNYEIDNDLVQLFSTPSGNIKELRSYSDGVRVFFIIKEDSPVVGGFYRKSAAIDQTKAGNMAGKRLKDQGYL